MTHLTYFSLHKFKKVPQKCFNQNRTSLGVNTTSPISFLGPLPGRHHTLRTAAVLTSTPQPGRGRRTEPGLKCPTTPAECQLR